MPATSLKRDNKGRKTSREPVRRVSWDDLVRQGFFKKSPWFVYEKMTPVFMNQKVKLTALTRRQADAIFDELSCPGYKQFEKRVCFQKLFHFGKMARYRNGCVVSPRGDQVSDMEKQVIDAAVKHGLFDEYRSKKGSPKMSRLIPSEKFMKGSQIDPWSFDPENMHKFVYLFNRETGEEMKINFKEEVPAKVQAVLETVNESNKTFDITHRQWDEWSQRLGDRRQIRPVLYARFTDDFKHHGRIYTGKYGHQGLRKEERRTIKFTDDRSVELDYSGLHIRMIYHVAKIRYDGDPYAIFPDTTPPMRLMVKVLINSLINAETDDEAVSACNNAMSYFNPRPKDGSAPTRKTGKALRDAHTLFSASKVTRLKFSEMVPLVKKHHKKVAVFLGDDWGIKLMNLDSQIALDILDHFSTNGVPVLPCHDSFLVPEYAKSELNRLMLTAYREKMGFLPVVRES